MIDSRYSPERWTRAMSETTPGSDKQGEIAAGNSIPDGAFATSCTIVREALALDLKECVLSRIQIAMELSRLTGRAISAAMIEAYIAESKPHRFPVELAPAWVQVMRSGRVLTAICEQVGLYVATREDMQFAAYGRTDLRRTKLARLLTEKI